VKLSQGRVNAGVQAVECDAWIGRCLSVGVNGYAAEQLIHVGQALGQDLNGRV
jgi:hypothetical protein